MSVRIQHRGRLIRASTLPGDTREDDVFPSHPNGIQVSQRQFLVLFGTRGYRGVDDNRSIVYQLRAGAYDGPVIKEGMVARSVDDWDPFGDGARYVRQHGHPGAFGVPRGARIGGRPAPHANLFVIKWRRSARGLDPRTGLISDFRADPSLRERTQAVEWVQVRLNDAEDALEVVQPAQALRQKGYEGGARLCSADVRTMNQSYTQAVPLTDDCTEWADVNHFDQPPLAPARIAALRYRFNPTSGVYEWVQTGPAIDAGLFEASLVRFGDDWVIASRTVESGVAAGQFGSGTVSGGPIAWMRTHDLFGEPPDVVRPRKPFSNAPLTAYRCADGVLRLLTGDPLVSPYGNARNPLYIWDIDPDRGFAASNRQTIFDTVAAGLPIPVEGQPKSELGKVLPHAGGTWQFLLHGVYSRSVQDPTLTGRQVAAAEREPSGIYAAALEYQDAAPSRWEF